MQSKITEGEKKRVLARIISAFGFAMILCLMLMLSASLLALRYPQRLRMSFSPVWLVKTVAMYKPLFLLFAVLLSVFAAYGLYRLLIRKGRKEARGLILAKEQTQGSDKLMDLEEKEEVFDLVDRKRPTGIILGREEETGRLLTVPFKGPKSPANGNFLIVGPSGTRKTSAVLLPNIFSCIQAGYSCVCTDPKGEIYSQTVAAAMAHGYNIRILNFMPEEFSHSDGWDAIKAIREANEPEEMAGLIVDVFCNNLSNVKKDFWEEANRNLFKAALLAVSIASGYIPVTSTENGAKGRTLAEVYNLIASDDCEERMLNLIKASSKNRKILWASFSSWAKHSQKDSIRAGLATKLSILQSENLTRVLSEDEINFSELNDKKTMLYIICSDKDSTYQCILALVSAMLFYQVTYIADHSPGKCLSRPLYFFFEEFRNIGYIPDLSKKISTLRSRKINMVFCYQDIDQLRDTYSTVDQPHEYQAIIANCALNVCCGSGDDGTNKFFSEKSGEMTIEEAITSISTNTFVPRALQHNPRGNVRKQAKGRAVMLESEIAKIKPDEILIIETGCNPTLEKKYFYKCHPLYQYQAVDGNGEIIVPSHLDHIPLWVLNEKRREAARVTGYDTDIKEPKLRVRKVEGLHLMQEINELDDKYQNKSSFLEKAEKLLYEPGDSGPTYSSKSLDYFMRDDD